MPVLMKVVRGVRKDGEMGLGQERTGQAEASFLKLALLRL